MAQVGPLSDDEKNEIRAKVKADNEALMRAFAPLYLGKFCPFSGEECAGPSCQVFLPVGEGNKVTGGACSVPLIASQVGPIAEALARGPIHTIIPSKR